VIYQTAIAACIANGSRLLEDAGYLREYRCFPSGKALAILAQEEFAKAYLLRLVDEQAIPDCPEVHRACRDHVCKHLVAVIMIHLFTPWADVLAREKAIREAQGHFPFPAKVADAINILVHEKLRKWRAPNSFWLDDCDYDKTAKSIWKGSIDQSKQNSLYVGIGKDGSVINVPAADEAEVAKELEIAGVLKDVAEGNDVFAYSEKDYVKRVLVEMFRGFSKAAENG
jgi:AbiV family abortive infection protein